MLTQLNPLCASYEAACSLVCLIWLRGESVRITPALQGVVVKWQKCFGLVRQLLSQFYLGTVQLVLPLCLSSADQFAYVLSVNVPKRLRVVETRLACSVNGKRIET